MRLPLLLLLFFQAVAQPPNRPQTNPEKASIAGSVLRSVSGEPLARAELRLTRVPTEDGTSPFSYTPGQESEGLPTVQTGNDGKFLLKDLDPGQYRMTVSRNGYAQQNYGSKNSSNPGSIINLAAGEKKTDVVFRLQPAGVITGRVRDSSGDPKTGYSVLLLKASANNGERQFLFQEDGTQTDDRGEYRFFWISPGRYYIRVNPPRSGQYETRRIVVEETTFGVFYPGVLDASSAVEIELGAGAEMGAVDIVIPRIAGYRIRGRIVESSTGKPPKAANVQIRPKKPEAFEYSFNDEPNRTEYNSRTGEFELRNVVPGSYWLSATVEGEFNGPISPERLADVRTGADIFQAVFQSGASTQIALEMNADDVNDIVLVLKSGTTVPARISVEGVELTSIKGWEDIRLTLEPEAGMNYQQSSRPSPDGTERIQNVMPGQYRIGVAYPPSANLYLKEIFYGRSDALSVPIEISDQAPDTISVLLSPNGGQVEGRLTDAQSQPVSGIDVVLIPDERERSRLFKTAVTDRDGHFNFKAVAPGSYKLFSWEELDSGEYFNKQLLSKYETQGRPVRVQESLKQSIDVKIIPAPKP